MNSLTMTKRKFKTDKSKKTKNICPKKFLTQNNFSSHRIFKQQSLSGLTSKRGQIGHRAGSNPVHHNDVLATKEHLQLRMNNPLTQHHLHTVPHNFLKIMVAKVHLMLVTDCSKFLQVIVPWFKFYLN